MKDDKNGGRKSPRRSDRDDQFAAARPQYPAR